MQRQTGETNILFKIPLADLCHHSIEGWFRRLRTIYWQGMLSRSVFKPPDPNSPVFILKLYDRIIMWDQKVRIHFPRIHHICMSSGSKVKWQGLISKLWQTQIKHESGDSIWLTGSPLNLELSGNAYSIVICAQPGVFRALVSPPPSQLCLIQICWVLLKGWIISITLPPHSV